MPVHTVDQVQARETKFKKALAALGSGGAAAEKRKLGKQVRRAQRRLRRMAAVDARRAKPAQA